MFKGGCISCTIPKQAVPLPVPPPLLPAVLPPWAASRSPDQRPAACVPGPNPSPLTLNQASATKFYPCMLIDFGLVPPAALQSAPKQWVLGWTMHFTQPGRRCQLQNKTPMRVLNHQRRSQRREHAVFNEERRKQLDVVAAVAGAR